MKNLIVNNEVDTTTNLVVDVTSQSRNSLCITHIKPGLKITGFERLDEIDRLVYNIGSVIAGEVGRETPLLRETKMFEAVEVDESRNNDELNSISRMCGVFNMAKRPSIELAKLVGSEQRIFDMSVLIGEPPENVKEFTGKKRENNRLLSSYKSGEAVRFMTQIGIASKSGEVRTDYVEKLIWTYPELEAEDKMRIASVTGKRKKKLR